MIVTKLRWTHTHTRIHTSPYTHWAYLVSKMKININTQFIYIFFHIYFFTRSMTNPLCHIDITFSAIMKEKLKTIKSILIILLPVRLSLLLYLFFFRSFSFLHNWLKTKALSHTHTRLVYGYLAMGLRPTQVESFANISLLSVCLAIIHVRHLVGLFPALWCHIKPSQVSATLFIN